MIDLKNKKILIASITDSGILRVRSELIKKLLGAGAAVIVVTPKKNDYKKLEEIGCDFIEFKIDGHGVNPISDYFAYKRYISVLKTTKPDLVLTFTTKPNIYCTKACMKLGIRYITNVTGRGVALATPGLKQKLMVYLLKRSLKDVSSLFFQNSNDMQFFKNCKIATPSVYRQIPGSGVNLEKYSVIAYPEANEGKMNFLFISRVLKQKGIDQYIEAAAIIRQNHPHCIFHVLGDTVPSYEGILKTAHEKGYIVYHGRVNNVGDYIATSNCTIHPSYYPEGMANVILESAAVGRPVITTDHPGCREGVTDEVTGYIIKPKDTTSLVNAIEKFLMLSHDEKVIMGVKGRKKIEKEFDRNIVTNAYIEEIKKIFAS